MHLVNAVIFFVVYHNSLFYFRQNQQFKAIVQRSIDEKLSYYHTTPICFL